MTACPRTFVGSASRKWHPESVADDFILDGKKKN